MPRISYWLWTSAIVAFWLRVFGQVDWSVPALFIVWAVVSEFTSVAWAKSHTASVVKAIKGGQS